MMNWGWGGMFIQMLFWIVLIIVIVWAVRYIARPNQHKSSSSEESALDILKKRYAKGEIDRDEFEQKKRDLG